MFKEMVSIFKSLPFFFSYSPCKENALWPKSIVLSLQISQQITAGNQSLIFLYWAPPFFDRLQFHVVSFPKLSLGLEFQEAPTIAITSFKTQKRYAVF